MPDTVLDVEITVLGGASDYGAGNYGAGVYSGGANNYVVFEPRPFDVVWEPDQVICNTDSQSFSTFAVYYDTAVPQNCLGITPDGNQGAVFIPAVQVTANHRLIGVWFGGDVGSNASASLVGQWGGLQE